MAAKTPAFRKYEQLMKNSTDPFKDFIRESLRNYEVDPPAGTWDNILSRINQGKKTAFLYVLIPAAAFALLLGAGLVFFLPGKRPAAVSENLGIHVQAPAAGTEQTITEAAGNASPPSAFKLKAGSTNTSASATSSGSPLKVSVTLAAKPADKHITAPAIEPAPEQEPVEGMYAETTPAEVTDSAASELQDFSEDVIAVLIPEAVPAPDPETALIPVTADLPGQDQTPEKTSRSWSLALHYGSLQDFSVEKQDLTMNSRDNSYSFDRTSSRVAVETSFFEDIENTSHNPPVSFGLLLSKPFARRWAAETGLLFTRLGYTVRTTEINDEYKEYYTSLDYIGIPLSLRFNLIDRRRGGLYISQSAVFEKGVSYHTSITSFTRGDAEGAGNIRNRVSGLQMSSLTALGGEIRIFNRLSLFGQAGLQCFFLNSTQPYSIRSARTAWPSFQSGLRLNLK
jgi:hypothetical protein